MAHILSAMGLGLILQTFTVISAISRPIRIYELINNIYDKIITNIECVCGEIII